MTVNGQTIWDNVKDATCWNRDVIHSFDEPFKASGGICVLRGNLAPDGAVIKPSAATPELMQHRGRAVVFEDIDHYKARVDDPDLDIDETCVMVLKNCGPKGYPGFSEVGNMALPAKILKKGITDMVRISRRPHERHRLRHRGPAHRAGSRRRRPAGPGPGRRHDRARRRRPAPAPGRRRCGAGPPPRRLAAARSAGPAATPGSIHDHVLQADQGCDFDFLVGSSGAPVPKESH